MYYLSYSHTSKCWSLQPTSQLIHTGSYISYSIWILESIFCNFQMAAGMSDRVHQSDGRPDMRVSCIYFKFIVYISLLDEWFFVFSGVRSSLYRIAAFALAIAIVCILCHTSSWAVVYILGLYMNNAGLLVWLPNIAHYSQSSIILSIFFSVDVFISLSYVNLVGYGGLVEVYRLNTHFDIESFLLRWWSICFV